MSIMCSIVHLSCVYAFVIWILFQNSLNAGYPIQHFQMIIPGEAEAR